jgi:type IV pilus assembly protein PilN
LTRSPAPESTRATESRDLPDASEAGGALQPVPPPAPEAALRSVPLSYGLWCLGLLGLCGLHRLYNRQPRSGLLWLLTFGLCGVGQLADLVLIPRMVTGLQPTETPETPESESPESAESPPAPPRPRVLPPRRSGLLPTLPPLDLLREHRQQQGQRPFSAVLETRPVLIRRGVMIGGLVLGVSLGACALLVIVHQMLRGREAEMVGYERQANQLRESVSRERAMVDALQSANRQLVARLTNVRSSSALLADLQLRVPVGVQLTKVEMLGPTEVRLEGISRDPVGFGRVNALELTLRRSPLFQAKGITLEKVERVPEEEFEIRPPQPPTVSTPPQPIKVLLPSAVKFQMKATLSPLAPDKLLGVMESLKAEGMVRRLERLEREGLLK